MVSTGQRWEGHAGATDFYQSFLRAFPDVKFEHCSGFKSAANMGNYFGAMEEARYLSGIAAGLKTKTDKLGFVAAFPIPEVLQGINAFTLGARSVNPKVQVRVVWVNTWYDPGKERDAANALMGQGADVVTHHTDSTAVVAAAEEKGRMAVAYHSNMAKFGPNAQLAAVTHQGALRAARADDVKFVAKVEEGEVARSGAHAAARIARGANGGQLAADATAR